VEIWHHDLNSPTQRFFDVVMRHAEYATGEYNLNTTVEIPLEPCTLEHWNQYPKIQERYTRLKINSWLCMPINTEMEILGKYSSATSKAVEIQVRKCSNSSGFAVPCATPTEIDQLFANETNFYFTIYFINPLINADSENFLSYYLEDSNYIIFSATGGAECQLMMEDYTIDTDESILPFSTIRTDSGGIITKNCIKNRYWIDSTAPDALYGTFFLFKSPISRSITRSFQKIDEILSYIGGLFGTIAICLFFIGVYNSYSFEITMGGYLFKPDDDHMGKQLRRYNFLYFLLHAIYAGLDMVGINFNWPSAQLYHECR
jgi:hypothetical protein